MNYVNMQYSFYICRHDKRYLDAVRFERFQIVNTKCYSESNNAYGVWKKKKNKKNKKLKTYIFTV